MSKDPGLIYVPILHTRRETAGIARSLGDSANTASTAKQAPDDDDRSTGDDRSAGDGRAVQEMWTGIAAKLNDAHLPYERVRIFQETMPVCGMEKEIAESLAAQGSRNHSLVLDLIGRGARLEGTEDPDLLVQEHEYLTALIASGSGRPERAAFEEYQARSKVLMEKRDTFIADRIKSTVREGELPLVFMGVRHQLDKQLDGDFMISYLIYRLPFRKIGDIYNV